MRHSRPVPDERISLRPSSHDRSAYTDGKSELVATLTAEARRWVATVR